MWSFYQLSTAQIINDEKWRYPALYPCAKTGARSHWKRRSTDLWTHSAPYFAPLLILFPFKRWFCKQGSLLSWFIERFWTIFCYVPIHIEASVASKGKQKWIFEDITETFFPLHFMNRHQYFGHFLLTLLIYFFFSHFRDDFEIKNNKLIFLSTQK